MFGKIRFFNYFRSRIYHIEYMETTSRNLPTGIQDFEDLRTNDFSFLKHE